MTDRDALSKAIENVMTAWSAIVAHTKRRRGSMFNRWVRAMDGMTDRGALVARLRQIADWTLDGERISLNRIADHLALNRSTYSKLRRRSNLREREAQHG